MKTFAISDFKSQALSLIQTVFQNRESLTITKRGKAIAKVIPYDEDEKPKAGKLKDAFLFEEDIVAPLGSDMWESA